MDSPTKGLPKTEQDEARGGLLIHTSMTADATPTTDELDALKQQLFELQSKLLESPRAQRKQLRKQVQDLDRQVNQAHQVFEKSRESSRASSQQNSPRSSPSKLSSPASPKSNHDVSALLSTAMEELGRSATRMQRLEARLDQSEARVTELSDTVGRQAAEIVGLHAMAESATAGHAESVLQLQEAAKLASDRHTKELTAVKQTSDSQAEEQILRLQEAKQTSDRQAAELLRLQDVVKDFADRQSVAQLELELSQLRVVVERDHAKGTGEVEPAAQTLGASIQTGNEQQEGGLNVLKGRLAMTEQQLEAVKVELVKLQAQPTPLPTQPVLSDPDQLAKLEDRLNQLEHAEIAPTQSVQSDLDQLTTLKELEERLNQLEHAQPAPTKSVLSDLDQLAKLEERLNQLEHAKIAPTQSVQSDPDQLAKLEERLNQLERAQPAPTQSVQSGPDQLAKLEERMAQVERTESSRSCDLETQLTALGSQVSRLAAQTPKPCRPHQDSENREMDFVMLEKTLDAQANQLQLACEERGELNAVMIAHTKDLERAKAQISQCGTEIEGLQQSMEKRSTPTTPTGTPAQHILESAVETRLTELEERVSCLAGIMGASRLTDLEKQVRALFERSEQSSRGKIGELEQANTAFGETMVAHREQLELAKSNFNQWRSELESLQDQLSMQQRSPAAIQSGVVGSSTHASGPQLSADGALKEVARRVSLLEAAVTTITALTNNKSGLWDSAPAERDTSESPEGQLATRECTGLWGSLKECQDQIVMLTTIQKDDAAKANLTSSAVVSLSHEVQTLTEAFEERHGRLGSQGDVAAVQSSYQELRRTMLQRSSMSPPASPLQAHHTAGSSPSGGDRLGRLQAMHDSLRSLSLASVSSEHHLSTADQAQRIYGGLGRMMPPLVGNWKVPSMGAPTGDQCYENLLATMSQPRSHKQ